MVHQIKKSSVNYLAKLLVHVHAKTLIAHGTGKYFESHHFSQVKID